MWCVLLIHPNIINVNCKGEAKDNVKVKCFILVKIYGNSPRKLLMMEAASTYETSVNFYQTTRCNNPEDSHLQCDFSSYSPYFLTLG
jgi:hypothetical protein